jgi:formate hydrogenlyase subunit 3/multisubunit Na+/H+ antiporter MnhD subunit
VGGLATAGLPLFATGFGKAAIENAAASAGYAWATPFIVVAAALTGAAVLTIAWTTGAATEAGRTEHHERWAPLLVVGAVLLGLSAVTTTIAGWAARAGSRFVATAAYQGRVLDGRVLTPVGTVTGVGLSTGGALLDVLAVALAVLLAVGLAHGTTRHVERSITSSRPWVVIRRVHDGSIGDSATWVTVGTAAIAVILATGGR